MDLIASFVWILALLVTYLHKSDAIVTSMSLLLSTFVSAFLANYKANFGTFEDSVVSPNWKTYDFEEIDFGKGRESWISIVFVGQWHWQQQQPGGTAIFARSLYITVELVLVVLTLANLLSSADGSLKLQFAKSDLLPESPYQAASLSMAAFSLIFWNLKTVFGSQWTYCANFYNEIRLKQFEAKDKIEGSADGLYSALCFDLIDCGLWRHKSFKGIFSGHLADCCDKIYRSKKMPLLGKGSMRQPICESELFRAFIESRLTLDDARDILAQASELAKVDLKSEPK